MIKKLFFSLFFMVLAINTNAQSIGFIGGFSGWSDVVMNTTDNTEYTLTNQVILENTIGKFRQDGSWTINWGATDFPSGTGTQGGPDIPIPAGTYNITFNRSTGAYSFTTVSTNFDQIGVYGGFNSWGNPSTPLVTADGIAYSKSDFHFNAAGVQFIKDNNTATTWGGTAFPSGTATAGGAIIPLTAGFYNVDFNKTSLLYNFVQVPVTMIGSAVSDWDTDVDMISSDGGVNFTLTNVTLLNGALKFRANNNWTNAWGSADFPSGVGFSGFGNDIPVSASQAGIYDVAFNRVTGAYTFTFVAPLPFDAITFNGLTLSTTDGNTYKGSDVYFPVAVNTNFVQNTSVTWGSSAFPSGTATSGNSSTIAVPAGYFTVTFDRLTGAYSFTTSTVALVGSASPTGWPSGAPGEIDATVMTSTDNGMTFTLSSVALTVGDAKFRVNNAWSTSYGDVVFPTGTAGSPGSNIGVTAASTYSVTFDRTTGAYNFTDVLSTNQFDQNSFSLAPNPTKGMFSINSDVAKVQIFNLTGQLVKTFNTKAANESLSISELNQGIYFVKVTDLNLNEKTIKLIKE
jgi:hypothetical protein